MNAEDDEILNGIVEILWASAWADHVEECGCQSLSGCEITEVMPVPPQEAVDAAYALASRVVDLEGMTLSELFAARLEEDAVDGITVDRSRKAQTRFGNCIAFEAMGSGVSWSDDHAADALSKYVHWDTSELCELAIEQCGCMILEVQVRSSDEYVDEDGKTYSEWAPGRVNTVYLDVYARDYRHAEGWANRHQSADGSSWETARDLGGLVWNITYDRPGLIDDLKKEGYTLDLSEYTSDFEYAEEVES